MANKIKILYFKVGEHMKALEMENTLQAAQKLVGGHIGVATLAEGLLLVCNDNGKVVGRSLNRIVEAPDAEDAIHGDFFICSSAGEEFASVTEEIEKKLYFASQPFGKIKVCKGDDA